MPGIKQLVSDISDDVILALAAGSYPPLVDGRILVGRQSQNEQSAPPRIIFIPVGSEFPMKDVYNASKTDGSTKPEMKAQIGNRSLLTDAVTFEVRCWGVSVSGDEVDDIDFTQTLYQTVMRIMLLKMRGSVGFSSGKWTDATFQSSQLLRDGREFVFMAQIMTPITERLAPMQNPSSNVAPLVTDSLTINGIEEAGCEDPDP